MDSRLIDPNNHAPEVSPDDVWGDALSATATVLPPKRTKIEPSSAAPAGKSTDGLRIGAETQRRPTSDTTVQLEVQELQCAVVRLDPEVPLPAKVPRQAAFLERPVENRTTAARTDVTREWGRSRKQSIHWIVGTGAGVASLVIVAMMMLPSINQSNAARPGADQDGLVVENEEPLEGIDSWNQMFALEPEARQVFQAYASAPLVEDFLPLIRNAEVLEPIIRQSPHSSLVSKQWEPPRDAIWTVLESDGFLYGLLEGSLPDHSNFSAYLMMSDDQLHLDWKATTAWGTASFDDLERNEGDPGEIRAKIIPSGFYTTTFPEEEFQSYQLVSPDQEKSIWCYARRKDAAAGALAGLFQNGEILKSAPELVKVTIRLEHGPAGALPNQWLVGTLLHRDWINP